jgi:hypothetical protein
MSSEMSAEDMIDDFRLPPQSIHERRTAVEAALIAELTLHGELIAERDEDLAETLLPGMQQRTGFPLAPNDIRNAACSEGISDRITVRTKGVTGSLAAAERIIGLVLRDPKLND